MKEQTKENKKGITLVAVIITVILMLILVSVITFEGIDSYKTSKVIKFVTEMQLLQAKVDDLVKTTNLEELNNLGLEITTNEQKNAINSAYNNQEITANDIGKYRFFTIDNILNELDVDNVQSEIMVNFETREIVSLKGTEYKGKTYYTQYKLPNGQNLVINSEFVQRDLAFDIKLNINGTNADVVISNIKISNGTLSYKEEKDNYWKQITNYTEANETQTIKIDKTGNYIFKLEDNTAENSKFEKTAKIILTNSPKTNLNIEPYNYAEDSKYWAYAQDSSNNYYVWIPRFVYKTNPDTNETELKFIKDVTSIATDGTVINDDWTLDDKFTKNDGTKLTGVWVSVESQYQTGLNMIDLLNDNNRTILTEI